MGIARFGVLIIVRGRWVDGQMGRGAGAEAEVSIKVLWVRGERDTVLY